MPLSSLILSRDTQEASVFECILGSLRIGVEIESDPALAWIRLRKSKVDAVIVDCDLKEAEAFLRKLQVAGDPESTPVLIVSGSGTWEYLEGLGAEFIAPKPVSVEQAVHTLSAARNLILQGRLRYHRENLDTPVSITGTTENFDAHLLNLSQSGIRVHMEQQEALRGEIGIHFLLPGTELSLEAQGEVAWTDDDGNAGIRLRNLSEPAKRDLRLWLERQYFQTGSD